VEGLFVEEAPSEVQDRIFEEFNTLSVIYGEPSESFISDKHAPGAAKPSGAEPTAASGSAADAPNPGAQSAAADDDDDEDDEPAAPAAPASPGIDLLGLLDDLPPAAPIVPAAGVSTLSLSASAALDQAAYQQRWMSLPTSETWTRQCSHAGILDQLSPRLAEKHVKCMAFGNVNDLAKSVAPFLTATATLTPLLLQRARAAHAHTTTATTRTRNDDAGASLHTHTHTRTHTHTHVSWHKLPAS